MKKQFEEPKQHYNLRIDRGLISKVRRKAKKEDRTQVSIFEEAMHMYFEKLREFEK